MVKEVIWSVHAKIQLKDILDYWKIRNGSSSYSEKLNNIFNRNANSLGSFPKIGIPTERENTRIRIIGNYIMVYEIMNFTVEILAIRDSRRQPLNLEDLIEK